MLNSVPENGVPNAGVAQTRVEFLLSQQRYQPALSLVRTTIAKSPELSEDTKQDLESSAAIAEAHIGMKKHAQAWLAAAAASEPHDAKPEDTAQDLLTAAEIYLPLGMDQQALTAAKSAQAYFAGSEQLDSELRSAGLAAIASRALGDETSYEYFSKKIVDIIKQLRQTWGPDFLGTYLARPDIRDLTQVTQVTQDRPKFVR